MKIREARKAAGMKQGDLARLVGVSNVAVSNWENGRTNPGTDKLKRIADALHTTVDSLLTEERAV